MAQRGKMTRAYIPQGASASARRNAHALWWRRDDAAAAVLAEYASVCGDLREALRPYIASAIVYE